MVSVRSWLPKPTTAAPWRIVCSSSSLAPTDGTNRAARPPASGRSSGKSKPITFVALIEASHLIRRDSAVQAQTRGWRTIAPGPARLAGSAMSCLPDILSNSTPGTVAGQEERMWRGAPYNADHEHERPASDAPPLPVRPGSAGPDSVRAGGGRPQRRRSAGDGHRIHAGAGRADRLRHALRLEPGADGGLPPGRPRRHLRRLRRRHAGAGAGRLRADAGRRPVVLVQSTSFRLEAFRIRIELFKRGLKVIEHVHLSRMPGEQGLHYIESLAYDPSYYRGVGHALKARIDSAQSGVVDSGDGARLVFGSAFESAKLNIGDYSGMNNVGGQFPLGEVFTEARDLEAVNGRVRIFVFGDTRFMVNRPATPITLIVERGRVVGAEHATPEFDEMLAIIRAHEGEVWLRELGFGMNRAFSRARLVNDIGTYERMCGIHLSLGAKHGVYQKPQFKRKDARYHVDVFALTEGVYLDGQQVYRDGAWQI